MVMMPPSLFLTPAPTSLLLIPISVIPWSVMAISVISFVPIFIPTMPMLIAITVVCLSTNLWYTKKKHSRNPCNQPDLFLHSISPFKKLFTPVSIFKQFFSIAFCQWAVKSLPLIVCRHRSVHRHADLCHRAVFSRPSIRDHADGTPHHGNARYRGYAFLTCKEVRNP